MSKAIEAGRTILVARISSFGTRAQLELAYLFHTILTGFDDLETPVEDLTDAVEQFHDPQGDHVTVYRRKNMKAVHIRGKDHDVLLSLGSARKVDDRGDNEFVDVLVDVLDTGDYQQVVTTSITRLCRNTELAGKIKHVLKKHRVSLLLANRKIEVWDQIGGSLIWTILVWFAEFEAQQIEARLTAGKIARAENGTWTLGFQPPPGWKVTENNTVEVDPEAAAALRFAISQVLAGNTNFSELVRKVVARWPELLSRRGKGKLADMPGAANQLRRSWFNPKWLDVYAGEPYHGLFVPHEDKKRLARTSDPSVLDNVPRFEFPLPEQPKPIATTEEIERLKAVLDELDAGRAGQRVPGTALGSGLTWSEADVVVEDEEFEEGDAT